MDRKLVSGISLALLLGTFGLISLLVILTKRHPYFVKKKLRLGALILSLTGASVGCATVTCYSPALDNMFSIDQSDTQTGAFVVSRAAMDTITGKISERHGNSFSYRIIDAMDSTVLSDNISPEDGIYDEAVEEFKIGFGHSLQPGTYNLRFYRASKDSVTNVDWYERSFPLTITE